jgi:hypothetical protein
MRARRLASYGFDVAVLGLPWLGVLGVEVMPPHGDWISGLGLALILVGVASLGTLVLLILQAALYLSRGRTLGMACLGLVAEGRRRGLTVLLDVAVIGLPLAVDAMLAQVLDGDTAETAMAAVLGLGFLGNLAPIAVGPRTLTDRLSGVQVRRDAAPVPAAMRPGIGVDALVLLAAMSPIASGAAGAAIGCAFAAGLLVVVEVVVRITSGATLGMRALRERRASL